MYEHSLYKCVWSLLRFWKANSVEYTIESVVISALYYSPNTRVSLKVRVGLEAISIVGDVAVSKSTAGGATEWMVTFLNNAGDLPELTADSSAMWGSVIVAVGQQRAGTSLAVSGSFELSVSGNGADTVTVSHDASVAEVKLGPRGYMLCC